MGVYSHNKHLYPSLCILHTDKVVKKEKKKGYNNLWVEVKENSYKRVVI